MVEAKIKPKYVEKKDNPTEKVRNINITKVYFSEDDGKYIKGKICLFFFVNLILKTKIWIYGSMECKIKNSNFISPQQALTLMQELNLL